MICSGTFPEQVGKPTKCVAVVNGRRISIHQDSLRDTKKMTVKLIYFDVRGVAERIRYLLAVAGVEYEDFRYPLTFGVPGDRSTMSRKEFDAAKAAGDHDVAMGKVPILEVDGVKIPQSKAIERDAVPKSSLHFDPPRLYFVIF